MCSPSPLSGAPPLLAALLAVAESECRTWQIQATDAASNVKHGSGCGIGRQGSPEAPYNCVQQPSTPARRLQPVRHGDACAHRAAGASGPCVAATQHTRWVTWRARSLCLVGPEGGMPAS